MDYTYCRLDKDQFLRRTVNEFIKSDDDEKFDQDYYEFEGINLTTFTTLFVIKDIALRNLLNELVKKTS